MGLPMLRVYIIGPSGGWYSYIQKANEDYRVRCRRACEDIGLKVVDAMQICDATLVFSDRGTDDSMRRGQAESQKLSKPCYKTDIEGLKETLRQINRERRKVKKKDATDT